MGESHSEYAEHSMKPPHDMHTPDTLHQMLDALLITPQVHPPPPCLPYRWSSCQVPSYTAPSEYVHFPSPARSPAKNSPSYTSPLEYLERHRTHTSTLRIMSAATHSKKMRAHALPPKVIQRLVLSMPSPICNTIRTCTRRVRPPCRWSTPHRTMPAGDRRLDTTIECQYGKARRGVGRQENESTVTRSGPAQKHMHRCFAAADSWVSSDPTHFQTFNE